MWITSHIAKNSRTVSPAAKGSILGASGGSVEVDTSLRHINLPVVAPYGIAYVPPAGEGAVLVPTDSGEACVGVVAPKVQNLKAGELMLYSAGGAFIVLKNDGTVNINGTVYGGA